MTTQRGPGSVGEAVGWILILTFLLFWLPLLGPFIAGVVGGKRSGGTLNALMASTVPSLVLANFLLMLVAPISHIPILGSVASFSAIALAFAGIAPLMLGALIGGLIVEGQDSRPPSRIAFLFILVASLGLLIPLYRQVEMLSSGAQRLINAVSLAQPASAPTPPQRLINTHERHLPIDVVMNPLPHPQRPDQHSRRDGIPHDLNPGRVGERGG
jgi:hypothetical protein